MIFLNSHDQLLLLLRDDIPTIRYPNMWDLPGGHLETGETPAACIAREMREELGLELTDFQLFEKYRFPDRLEYSFWMQLDLEIDRIVLTEGQRLQWFSHAELQQMELAFGFNQTVERFFAVRAGSVKTGEKS